VSDLDVLISLIEETSGIVVPDRDRGHVLEIANERARACDAGDLGRYVQQLAKDRDDDEWRSLLALVTVKESFLFRVPTQFQALAALCLPDLVARRRGRPLRLWSAGCARGEEAATLAVVLAECRETASTGAWSVLATDVDESALEEARRGVYGGRAMATVPEEYVDRHFRRRGDLFELDPRLGSRIEYRRLNLVRLPLDLPEAPFDVVFFRNVLIYFRPEVQRQVVAAVAEATATDGYLFVGPSESLRGMVPGLRAVDMGGCFCYRWQGEAESPEAAPAASLAVASEVLVPPSPDPGAARSGATHREMAALVVDAEGRGDDGAARTLADEGTHRYPEDPVLWAIRGIVLERRERRDEAVRCYRAALYLDPDLAQVRFLLAAAMQGSGLEARARREYRTVIDSVTGGRGRALPYADDLGLPEMSEVLDEARRRLGKGGRGDA
jgi:chemotaxis protein methyltransferase CheR